MQGISPHAIVEKGAKLAEGVRIGPFSYIGPKVRIGPGCIIENNVTIVGRTSLGERNHVFPMAAIGLCPDGPADGGACVTGDANSFREHVTIYGGADGPTRIGTDNLLMIDCTIGPVPSSATIASSPTSRTSARAPAWLTIHTPADSPRSKTG